jgi:hypothetical protein
LTLNPVGESYTTTLKPGEEGQLGIQPDPNGDPNLFHQYSLLGYDPYTGKLIVQDQWLGLAPAEGGEACQQYGGEYEGGEIVILPTPTPLPPSGRITVSGYVFVDTHNKGVKDADEDCFNGSVQFWVDGLAKPPFPSTTSCNPYTYQVPKDGYHLILISPPPSGYECTGWFGTLGSGDGCSVTFSADATINFGIAVPTPDIWFQTQGGDVHSFLNFRSLIPEDKFFFLNLDNYPGLLSFGGYEVDFGHGSISSRNCFANSYYCFIHRRIP